MAISKLLHKNHCEKLIAINVCWGDLCEEPKKVLNCTDWRNKNERKIKDFFQG